MNEEPDLHKESQKRCHMDEEPDLHKESQKNAKLKHVRQGARIDNTYNTIHNENKKTSISIYLLYVYHTELSSLKIY